ncbi:MAG: homogentisate phytyltransferase [Aphanocapsa sp. GSE-SYN-MK-11-07L]|jgi:homogentisate phytyltransferase/homogentisate geranylgeranyltransferase|nr:homogentisate phytyltransferase [Aphanocapsa sp. GSE-SYN-MK-11-07L]
MSLISPILDWQRAKLSALWKFSRPHTIIGTSLSVLGLYGMALAPAAFSPASLTDLGWAWLACLAGNVYIVGLNQLTDVAIDQINKPHLPLAAGEFSRSQGIAIVSVSGIVALAIAIWQGPGLLVTVALSLLIGTAYSLPPIRLKRFPVWAALCIFGVRGVIVNLGLFLHFQSQFGSGSGIPPQVWALTVFVVVFTFAIAIFKDIPDIEGDRQYKITTLTIKLGARRVFNLALWVLTTCYLGMAIAALAGLPGVQTVGLIVTQLGLLALLWWRSRGVDLADKKAIASFYQFIWKLFFLEYLIFPIICLFGQS